MDGEFGNTRFPLTPISPENYLNDLSFEFPLEDFEFCLGSNLDIYSNEFDPHVDVSRIPTPEIDYTRRHSDEITREADEKPNLNSCPSSMSLRYPRGAMSRNYKIRCDIETVDTQTLTKTFRAKNCVYPKAMLPPEQYRGKRRRFEMMYNDVGWKLAYLNPEIRHQRGLIQCSVDTYRNFSKDASFWSRRTRRRNLSFTRLKSEYAL